MLAYYYGISILVVLVVLAVIATTFLQRRVSRNTSTTPPDPNAIRVSEGGGWLSGLPWRRNQNPTLRQWLIDNTEDVAIKRWLRRLSKKEFKALVEDFKRLGKIVDLDLNWLTTGILTRDEQLLAAVKEQLLLQAKARHRVVTMADDVFVFNAYQDIVKDKADADLVKKLYVQLVERELVEVPPAELSMASSREGRKYAINQILALSDSNWEAFSNVMKDVLELNASTTETTTTDAQSATVTTATGVISSPALASA